MFIKNYLAMLVEKITGRKCTRCRHNCAGRCCHPDGRMFMRCWDSITRPGFEKRPPRYLKPADQHRKALRDISRAFSEGFEVGLETAPAPLTPEEEHQLQKIRAALQEAEDTARESGLLED